MIGSLFHLSFSTLKLCFGFLFLQLKKVSHCFIFHTYFLFLTLTLENFTLGGFWLTFSKLVVPFLRKKKLHTFSAAGASRHFFLILFLTILYIFSIRGVAAHQLRASVRFVFLPSNQSNRNVKSFLSLHLFRSHFRCCVCLSEKSLRKKYTTHIFATSPTNTNQNSSPKTNQSKALTIRRRRHRTHSPHQHINNNAQRFTRNGSNRRRRHLGR